MIEATGEEAVREGSASWWLGRNEGRRRPRGVERGGRRGDRAQGLSLALATGERVGIEEEGDGGAREAIGRDGDRAGARVNRGLGGPWAISVEGEKARRPSRLD